jgi:glycosyltransferase involved in cell wall biosynthesis
VAGASGATAADGPVGEHQRKALVATQGADERPALSAAAGPSVPERWTGSCPRWDGFCVMSNRIYAWFLAELPAHWLARHRGLLLDVIRLESATARWRLPSIPAAASVFFDSWGAAQLPRLSPALRARGSRVLVSCDDEWWHPPQPDPTHPEDPDPAELARVERGLREADRVVVHTAAMAERVQRFNRSICVMPQALPPLDELPRRPTPGEPRGIRLGWVGTSSHLGDLELIGPAVGALLARHPDVTVVLAGPSLPPWAVALRGSPQVELHPGWVRTPAYYRWVASLALDGFLAPLAAIPFNLVKPCLKPLEAAGLGLPVIASRVGSYAEDLEHEETALLVENTTEAWLAALTRVVEDAALRAHLTARGLAWAATRTIEQTGPLWAALWQGRS